MKLHEEVLTPRQRGVLRKLGPFMTTRGFYLGGGTAIAIYLGHRRSVDLDWFTGEQIVDAMVLARQIQEQGVAWVARQVEPGTLHGEVSGTRVTLLEYRYPLLQPTTHWADYDCMLASLDDLACMKLSAVAQWGSKRDFVDLYALGVSHRPLAELLGLYRRKYGIEDIAHVLYALSYFEDAERERMPTMRWNVNWRTIKEEIQRWIKERVR